jgi:hypothetical protein
MTLSFSMRATLSSMAMRLLLLAALAACSSKASAPPRPTRVKLPPSATELKVEDVPVGLRDSRTVITFCLADGARAELSTLPCVPTPTGDGHASCASRKLHTEVTVDTQERGTELLVTVVDSEYDNCLFEGCQKPP